jgi:hypothetical protein
MKPELAAPERWRERACGAVLCCAARPSLPAGADVMLYLRWTRMCQINSIEDQLYDGNVMRVAPNPAGASSLSEFVSARNLFPA